MKDIFRAFSWLVSIFIRLATSQGQLCLQQRSTQSSLSVWLWEWLLGLIDILLHYIVCLHALVGSWVGLFTLACIYPIKWNTYHFHYMNVLSICICQLYLMLWMHLVFSLHANLFALRQCWIQWSCVLLSYSIIWLLLVWLFPSSFNLEPFDFIGSLKVVISFFGTIIFKKSFYSFILDKRTR